MMALPKHTRVVIVGGGIIGCSVAYHLALMGCTDVVLLEQGKLSAGTTWHAAGLVGQLRPNRPMTAMSRYGIELYARLEQETGLATGWKACGSLYVAQTSDRLRMMMRQASLARRYGVHCEAISPREAADHFPLMRSDDLAGALWLPEDGKVNPADLCAAIAKGARQRGVLMFEGIRAIAVHSQGQGRLRRVCGLRVRGTGIEQDIGCELLVNCVGQWARQFAAGAGVSVPLHAAEHFYIVTGKIAGVHPMLPVMRDPDSYIYYKEEVGGLLMGGFEPSAKPWKVDPIPDDFQFQLLNEDWDQFEVLMKHALHRTPCLEKAQIKMLLNGPESFTPDGNFIMGEAPELRHYFVCAGFNSSGIANSAGAGKMMAAWMLEGDPGMDVSALDIRRFSPLSANKRALAARTVESLGLHYAMPWPRQELQTARPLRTPALYDQLAAKAAVFGSINGWERALYFQPASSPAAKPTLDKPDWLPWVQAEQRAAQQAVAIFDQSSRAKYLIQGEDALALLQRLSVSPIDLAVNRMVRTIWLNTRGGIETALTVIRLEADRFLLLSGAQQATRDMHWIGKHQGVSERVFAYDVSAMYSVLSLVGPASEALLSRLCPQDLSAQSFPAMTAAEIDLGYARLRLARVSDAGKDAFELYLPVEMTRHVYLALHEAGADLGLRDAGHFAFDAMRIERGYPEWGADFGSQDSPLALGFDGLIDWGKTELVGYRALMEARVKPRCSQLVKLVFEDPQAYAWGGEPIVIDGESDHDAGVLTSAGWGIDAGRCVALAHLRGPSAQLRHQGSAASVFLWGKPSSVLVYSL